MNNEYCTKELNIIDADNVKLGQIINWAFS